jgi:hypothetical protein
MAIRCGVDWFEVGTPLIIAEGMRGVRELRARFPETPIVADLKYGTREVKGVAFAMLKIIRECSVGRISQFCILLSDCFLMDG